MNILFLTIGRMESIEKHGIYTDLLRCFQKNEHHVYTVSPYEKRTKLKTELKEVNEAQMLHVSVGNITKCGIIEKGLSTLLIERKFLKAIKKYFCDIKFDCVIYSTPPITFSKVIKYVKKRDAAKTYLMLKDIFPQNAVDIGMMSKSGFIYKYFHKKEKKLYDLSDTIGCMSPANVDYVLKHNPQIAKEKISLCPNSIELQDMSLSEQEKQEMRAKYGIPQQKKVFVYGGNLGRPQDVPFIVKCLKACAELNDVFFVIAGSGTDRYVIENYVKAVDPKHLKLFGQMPKEEYDKMVACCDIGLIFLDYRFTIPNFPSRLLSYMQAKLPILACTDSNTDIGKIIVEGDFGWWCKSDDAGNFSELIRKISFENTESKAKNAVDFLSENYCCDKVYENIINKIQETESE